MTSFREHKTVLNFDLIIFSFSVSFLALILAEPIAVRSGLVDLPNNVRKLHVGEIPLVGGIAIYIGVMTTFMLFVEQSQSINLFLMSSALLLFVGVVDDKYDISAKFRLVFQVFAASVMIFGTERYIDSFGAILGFDLPLGFLGIPITVLAVVGCINAFNMMDGIDGLVGIVSLVSFIALAFMLKNIPTLWALVPLGFCGAIAAYLISNLFGPNKMVKKVFMGDAGNMVIGLAVVWLLVIGTTGKTQAFKPVTALYLIAVPLMDMVSVIIRRIKSGHSPLAADRMHVHHLLLRVGLSKFQTLMLLLILSTGLAVLGCLTDVLKVPELIVFISFLMIFNLYHHVIKRIEKLY